MISNLRVEPITVDTPLYPGDLLDLEYVVVQANEVLIQMATRAIKETVSTDPRFDYQGSRWETRVDKSGLTGAIRDVQYLIITVMVRKTPRGTAPQPAEAGFGKVTQVIAGVLFSLAVAAGVMYSQNMKFTGVANLRRAEIVQAIATDSNIPSAEKLAALEALGTTQQKSVGTGLAAFGGSMVTAAIIIAVLWGLSLSARRGGGD